MMWTRVNAAELHQKVGEILSKIRYTNERFVIERRGVPVAAVIPIQDLEQLEFRISSSPKPRSKRQKLAALERSKAVGQLILKHRGGKVMPDSAATIREMRRMRTRAIANLR